ncbi:UAP56-interacting factor isoform X2 [Hemicordylus capensis]|uniref:UAP56-interacting factor isoform X2 n=1 Tax=Hemicordylus capensis TaxID=884348 RepID=UPI002304890B|nr:UAP56-interacting factor isoform X2 [Hemicordylus capensis]
MNGFGPGVAPLRSTSETLEKIDMSLDDIIKLNKKEERKQYSPRVKRGVQLNGTRQFKMRRTKWGIQEYAGFGKTRLGRRKRVAGKRQPYGVKTGLAARKALRAPQGISPLNRPPLSEKNVQRNYSVLKRKTTTQRQSELQRKQGAVIRSPTLMLNRRTNMQSPSARIGNKLYQQKDTRQATFLFRRGLKVKAQVHPEDDLSGQGTTRAHPWRTSTTNGGILTVSIDNPGAVPSPISLKPRLTSTPMPPFLMKSGQSEEKKIPKGVPLQFDINSVGKQTNMTLNERFGILKEQRTALSQNKGSRFVTVG